MSAKITNRDFLQDPAYFSFGRATAFRHAAALAVIHKSPSRLVKTLRAAMRYEAKDAVHYVRSLKKEASLAA
jgi:hypothetical protein